MKMGRHPRSNAAALRPDWVYVGLKEAAVLAGVSMSTVEGWRIDGKLSRPVALVDPGTGWARKVYRLDDVLALRDGRKG